MVRKLWVATVFTFLASLFAVGAPAGAVGVCGGGPGTQKPMSVMITVNVYWTPMPRAFTYEVSGPRVLRGTIAIPPGRHEGSVAVGGLGRGTWTVAVDSEVTPRMSTEVEVVPPGCGTAADFTFNSGP